MKVRELPYTRVTLEEIREASSHILAAIRNARSTEEVLSARADYKKLYNRYATNAALAEMRYTINTADEFYVAERSYYDEIDPEVQSLGQQYMQAMMDSPFRKELEEKLGSLLFRSFAVSLKSMRPEIIPEMQQENAIVMEYSQLMASMEFEFRGEKMPRARLMGFAKDADRAVRRECYEALGRGLSAHAEKLDDIFDRLVKVRDAMAKKMGCKNFVELGYYRMGRLDYDAEKIAVFRRNVLEDIVPVVSRLRLENAERLGITDSYMLYDNDVVISGGDPRPAGKEAIFSAAREMYHSMGSDAADFIDMMLENEAFDVEARQNKWGGGYCTCFEDFRQPFILANFNGSADDVDVVTHEAGHALNAYLSFDNEPFELNMGMETAETHSMSMEFFAWPFMDRFFGEVAADYRRMHALNALTFIPYDTAVDYFQHLVYENPDWTPARRKACWNELEAQFRPWLSTAGIPYLEEGTRWQYQMHIYESPFYYIDYVLAQTAAFAFLMESRKDYADAFARYLALSRQGGTKVFSQLLTEAGLGSPFTEGALRELAVKVQALLEQME